MSGIEIKDGYSLTNKMRRIRRECPLTSTEQALYYELIAICNEGGWSEVFSVSSAELYNTLQISKNSLIKARMVLINAQLISYKSGKSKRQFSSYSFTTTSKYEPDRGTDKGTDRGTDRGTDSIKNVTTIINYKENETKTETKQKLKIKNFGKMNKDGFNTMPGEIDVGELPQLKITAAIQIVKICKQADIDQEKTLSMWQIFKIQNLTGKKYYQNIEAVQSHFINWIKTQTFKSDGKDKGHISGKTMEFDAP